jgi:hypothetical protein
MARILYQRARRVSMFVEKRGWRARAAPRRTPLARTAGATNLSPAGPARYPPRAPMVDRHTQARALVESALSEVEAELAAPRHALRPEQLCTCRDTLRAYLAALDGGSLPPRRDRAEPLCRLVADGWPFDLPLAALVLRAERAWRNV